MTGTGDGRFAPLSVKIGLGRPHPRITLAPRPPIGKDGSQQERDTQT